MLKQQTRRVIHPVLSSFIILILLAVLLEIISGSGTFASFRHIKVQPSSQPAPGTNSHSGGSISTKPAPGANSHSGGSTPTKTVFIIMMENHNWSSISGNPSAPYINKTLLPEASYAQQYYNPPGNHPSEPNYLWLEAGTNFGIYNDNSPYSNHQGTTQHLVTLLKNANISWKSYQEDIPGTSCPLGGTGMYTPSHNPTVYFDDVTNTNNLNSAYCIAHERPFPELAKDLQNNTVARYNFITPNWCDDMHDSCAPIYDPVKQGDIWLSQNLPAILKSQAYQNGGIVFITWDEAVFGDGPVGLIVLSPDAKGGGYSNTIHYTHSSTLRTIEEIFGVSPFLGNAANATDLRDLFKTFP